MNRKLKFEHIIDLGDKYIGFKLDKITAQYEQYHCDIFCFPISIKFTWIRPFINFSIELGFIQLYIKVGVGKNEN